MLRLALLAGSCALVLAACQSAATSGTGCARSSDCAEPLVCASGVCRDQCADARDCLPTYSCATFRGAGVCVPPAQPVPCVFNADCGALFCRSGHCVQQCTVDHDCERGTCAAGTCTEPVLTPPAPDGGPAIDAGADSGSTTQCPAHGVFCQTDGLCHDLSSDNHACGQCGVSCPAAGACEAGACVCGGMPCAPSNDDCANAMEVTFDASGHAAASGSLAGATQSLPDCIGIDGPEVFFRAHVATRSVVFATSYANYEVDLLSSGCGTPDTQCGPLCNDGSGTYYDAGVFGPDEDVFFAVRALAGAPLGMFTASLVAVPVGDAVVAPLGDATISVGDHPSATVVLDTPTADTGCSTGNGHALYWITCSGGATQHACASSGSGLSLQSLSGTADCNTTTDGSGCITVDHPGERGGQVVMLRAVTGGTTVMFDVLGM